MAEDIDSIMNQTIGSVVNKVIVPTAKSEWASGCLVISIYMDNINPKTIIKHRAVMAKYNSQGFANLYALTTKTHGETMDLIWTLPELAKFHTIMFLDIDAVPLCDSALSTIFAYAGDSFLVGNAQSSNHINNGRHMFAAPSALCLSRAMFERMGKPSAVPTARGDVGEEYTYCAEELLGTTDNIFLFQPLKYDHPVNRMEWETDRAPTWKLANGKEYGVGTTFGYSNIYTDEDISLPMIWHCFQSFHPGHQELFWTKCDDLLALKE
ncbi:MAG: hypothetical protein ACREQ5_06745 [Candidatus Dormibacteria bacterium]